MNIILGGTHGLGHEISKTLQQDDLETFVVGRSYDEAQHGAGMQVDLAEAAASDYLAQRIKDIGDKALASFFWVSGYGYKGDFAAQPDTGRMAAVNFANVIPAAQAAWSKLQAANAGNFVVVSSSTGIKAREDEAVYAGTKHAQVGFARSLGLEAKRLESDVRVALFLPGGMQTPFWDGDRPESYDKFLDPAEVARHICGQIALQQEAYLEEEIRRPA